MTRGRSVRGAEITGAGVTGAEVTGAEMVWAEVSEGRDGLGPKCLQIVVKALVLGHVHTIGLDLKEKAISVRVEELAAFSILHFELVVIEAVHQVLGEIQSAHAHIHRAIEY